MLFCFGRVRTRGVRHRLGAFGAQRRKNPSKATKKASRKRCFFVLGGFEPVGFVIALALSERSAERMERSGSFFVRGI